MDKTHEINYLTTLIKGKTLEEAKELLALGDYTMRVVRQDGRFLTVTRDVKDNRVNVDVEDDIILAVMSIG